MTDVMKVTAGAAALIVATGFASKYALQGTLGGIGNLLGNWSFGRQKGKAAKQLAMQSKKTLRGL